MDRIKMFSVPNFFTAANMACGFVGIQLAITGNVQGACYCIFLAAIVDFLDGFVARLFNATSEFGKQLDSLCDVVSFGVLPGFIMFSILEEFKWVAVVMPVFSALRLAKFNIDQRQSDGFIGVPTPITALLVTSLAFVFEGKVVVEEVNYFLLGTLLISSFLMVSELTLISLKFKGFDFFANKYRYALVFVSLAFVITLKFECFIPIYISYILISIVHTNLSKKIA